MDENVLRNQVNASGFPFQLRIEREVMDTFDLHKWTVEGHEHRWSNTDSGTEGFIDLVLNRRITHDIRWRFVIECKRLKDGNWVFITPSTAKQNLFSMHTLVSHLKVNGVTRLNWKMIDFSPQSPVSSFCSVPGQSAKETPMLEKIASNLLDSLESLATEDVNVSPRLNDTVTYYFPMLVTNAELYKLRV